MLPTELKLPWFALRVKSHHEQIVATALQCKNYESYHPIYTCVRRWSDRVRELSFPLFPGYVFCRFDPQSRLPILMTPGVAHIVSVGKTPAAVEESEIGAIQAVVAAGLKREPWPFLEIGDRVIVRKGPVQGLEGILIREKRRSRVVVSITLLRRSIAIEMDSDWLAPAAMGVQCGI
jgi:transcription antitermination factor NusG